MSVSSSSSTSLAFLDALAAKPLVMDGGLGTQLEKLIPKDDPVQPKHHPLWSGITLWKSPHLVEKVHQLYVDAGLDLIITGTYQTSYGSLKKFTALTDSQVLTLWQRSVRIARNAAKTAAKDRHVYIAGSVGPFGAYLVNGAEYTGQYGDITNAQVTKYHYPLVHFFDTNTEVDVIALETIPNFKEIKVLLNLLKNLQATTNSKKPFYLSMNFKDNKTLCDGTPLTSVMRYINQFLDRHASIKDRFFAIGVNCMDYKFVADLVQNMDSLNEHNLAIVIYPNLGFDYFSSREDLTYESHKNEDQWSKAVKKWMSISSNVRIIGGCCSTGPEEIGTVRQIFDQM